VAQTQQHINTTNPKTEEYLTQSWHHKRT